MSNEVWTKITLRGRREDLDTLVAVMSMVDNGLEIEDFSDLSLNGMYGELMDEALLKADRTRVAVSVYLPAEKSPLEVRAYLLARLSSLGIPAEVECSTLHEEDWAESWKQYYRPIPLGRITIVPAWQEYTAAEGEIIVRMDPGMAFGTGTHETTRLVVELMQSTLREGERVLDLGCGSGILAICAAKLGAGFCAAYDIDPVAVRVARENVKDNGVEQVVCGESDLLQSVDRSAPYSFAVINIVADVILRLLPDLGSVLAPGARAIFSGIIGERGEEVEQALRVCGFRVLARRNENDWLAILATREA